MVSQSNSSSEVIRPLRELEFQQIKSTVEKLCGITLADNKHYLVESRLLPLIQKYQVKSYLELMALLKGPLATELQRDLINAMTTRETLWFRDKSPYVLLEEEILPLITDPLRYGLVGPLKIWSAACSTGQEPYSIAMTVQEYAHKQNKLQLLNPGGLNITATDISEAALSTARAGVYDRIAMSRGLPPHMQEKYFKPSPKNETLWEVDTKLKRHVQFQACNLMENFEASLGKFDIIFIRNVAIYFSQDVKTKLFKKIAHCLKPNGFLILGSTESLNGVSDLFTAVNWRTTTYYVHAQQKGSQALLNRPANAAISSDKNTNSLQHIATKNNTSSLTPSRVTPTIQGDKRSQGSTTPSSEPLPTQVRTSTSLPNRYERTSSTSLTSTVQVNHSNDSPSTSPYPVSPYQRGDTTGSGYRLPHQPRR
jgi:chemotaxis protein methyltransferase CheR